MIRRYAPWWPVIIALVFGVHAIAGNPPLMLVFPAPVIVLIMTGTP